MIKIIRSYYRGIRVQSFFLAILIFFSLILTVRLYGSYKYERVDRDVLSRCPAKDRAYYVGSVMGPIRPNETAGGSGDLSGNDAVEAVLYTYYTFCTYGDKTVKVEFVTPEFLSYFPLVTPGFEKGSEGMILYNRDLSHYVTEKGVAFTYGYPESKTDMFPFLGHGSYPYRAPELGRMGTILYASDLFSSDVGAVIILDGEKINDYPLERSDCFIIVFGEDATEEEIESTLLPFRNAGYCHGISDILSYSDKFIGQKLSEIISTPGFLLCVSVMAFISILILTFKKKEKELAIIYLCGASKRKCTLITFIAFTLTAFIPSVICAVIILLVNRLDWLGVISLNYIMIGADTLLIPGVFFLLASLIAVLVVILSMARHTPKTYLRSISD